MRLRKLIIAGMLCLSLLGVTACRNDKGESTAADGTGSGYTEDRQESVSDETTTQDTEESISEELTIEEETTEIVAESVSTDMTTEKATEKKTEAQTAEKATEKKTEAQTTEKATEKKTEAQTAEKATEKKTEAQTTQKATEEQTTPKPTAPNPKKLLKMGTKYTGTITKNVCQNGDIVRFELRFSADGTYYYKWSPYVSFSEFFSLVSKYYGGDEEEWLEREKNYICEYNGEKYIDLLSSYPGVGDNNLGNEETYSLTDEEIIVTTNYMFYPKYADEYNLPGTEKGMIVFTMSEDGNLVIKSTTFTFLEVGMVFSCE